MAALIGCQMDMANCSKNRFENRVASSSGALPTNNMKVRRFLLLVLLHLSEHDTLMSEAVEFITGGDIIGNLYSVLGQHA